tara:strand:- start:62 stop:667 length:606 start_codon:yes stop_codon:yes gene_type:complete
MTVKLVGSTSGSVSLQAPASTTGGAHRVLTLPDVDGTIATTTTGGKLLQVVSTTKTNQYTETISDGTQSSNNITGLTVSITPSNANNKILLTCTLSMSGGNAGFNFFKDGSVISGATGNADGSKKRVFGEIYVNNYAMVASTMHYLDTAGGTSAITYSVRLFNIAQGNSFIAVNTNVSGRSGISAYDMVGASVITAMEIAA